MSIVLYEEDGRGERRVLRQISPRNVKIIKKSLLSLLEMRQHGWKSTSGRHSQKFDAMESSMSMSSVVAEGAGWD